MSRGLSEKQKNANGRGLERQELGIVAQGMQILSWKESLIVGRASIVLQSSHNESRSYLGQYGKEWLQIEKKEREAASSRSNGLLSRNRVLCRE